MKVVIFDLDGTIADSMDLWDRLGEIYLTEKGTKIPENLKEALGELSLEEGAAYIKDKVGLTATIDEIKEEIKAMLVNYYKNKIKLKPFIIEILEELRGRETMLVLATASDESLARVFLKRQKIDKYFEAIYTPYNIGYGKKQSEFFEEVIKRIGHDIKDIWVFEDALHAMISAKDAGLKVLAIKDESASKDEERIKEISDIYIEDFKNLEVDDLWKNY